MYDIRTISRGLGHVIFSRFCIKWRGEMRFSCQRCV